ncbi:MAG: iron-containing alcohol dehydrogenase [Deferrisomatales bacterium]|nr:iron-containing alcohol dehydrogenase [Deferrisomatales bacterium]
MHEASSSLHHCKFEVPEIVFGRGLIHKVGSCARRLGGRKVLLVSDEGLLRAGWVDVALDSLRGAGLDPVYYGDVTPNPKDTEVEEGAREYLRQGTDVIVGLGGGSAMDAAKGIAVLVSNQGRIRDYKGTDTIQRPLPPMVMCPTTCGTGSDVSQFAVITDTLNMCKTVIGSRTLAPDISLTDPDTLSTLPQEFVCTSGLDALSHAIEAFFSLAATSLTDVHAIRSVRLLASSLVTGVREQRPEDLEQLSRASLHAGMALSNALLGMAHALAHPLGGRYDLNHGSLNAVLLPEVIRYDLPAVWEKLPELSWGLGCRTNGDPAASARAIEDTVCQLLHDTGAPTSLRSLGVVEVDLPELATKALNDVCLVTCPRQATQADLLGVLEKTF